MKPKYLNKHGGFRVNNLFQETTDLNSVYTIDQGRDVPVFTIKSEDWTNNQGTKLISMQKLFLSFEDITGYDFAMKVLGSYEHFSELCNHRVIGNYIEQWKEVVKAKMDSDSIKEIKRIATDGGTQVELSAAKYLANREYESKGSVGKPVKKQNARKEASEARQASIDTKKELERLGLH